jgi:hypothetical protein
VELAKIEREPDATWKLAVTEASNQHNGSKGRGLI